MYWVGHISLTAGLASAGSMFWIRKRVLEQIDETSHIPPIAKRVRQRAKYALAGLAFTGCATAVSGTLDSFEKTLGFTHRTGAHSLPLIGGVYTAAKLAQKKGIAFVRWAFDQVGYEEQVKPVLDSLKNLSSWILNGGLAGALTHILGDIPTLGHGATALSILYPLTNRGINIGLVSAASPALNGLALKAGSILAVASWAVSGTYLVTHAPPKAVLKDRLCSLTETLRLKVDTDSLYQEAVEEMTKFVDLIWEIFESNENSKSNSEPPSAPNLVKRLASQPIEDKPLELKDDFSRFEEFNLNRDKQTSSFRSETQRFNNFLSNTNPFFDDFSPTIDGSNRQISDI